MAKHYQQSMTQSKSVTGALDRKAPYITTPEFSSFEAAYTFDRLAFANNPKLLCFLRRCSPVELPPGKYEAIHRTNEQVFLLVAQVRPGCHKAVIISTPSLEAPEDFCAGLQTDPEFLKLVRSLEDSHENN